jgi:uncharacterized protein YbjT (DUF2867 family)
VAFPEVTFVRLDLAEAVRPNDWRVTLAGVEAVVNAAGLLRARDMQRVHVEMPSALAGAAAAAGVRRMILISAISPRADVATDYAAPNWPARRCFAARIWDGRSCDHHWCMATEAMAVPP